MQTEQEQAVIDALASNGGELRAAGSYLTVAEQRGLFERHGVDLANLRATLARMESGGLIRRERVSPESRRVLAIVVPRAGRAKSNGTPTASAVIVRDSCACCVEVHVATYKVESPADGVSLLVCDEFGAYYRARPGYRVQPLALR